MRKLKNAAVFVAFIMLISSVMGNNVFTATTNGSSLQMNGAKSLSAGNEALPISEEYTAPEYIDFQYAYDANMIEIGDVLPVECYVYPPEAATSISWRSSDEAVATVNENGYVTVCGYGKVCITATADNGVSAERFLTFRRLNTNRITLKPGDSFKLDIVNRDENDEYIEWYTYDSAATVDSDGTVHAVSEGYAWINCSEGFGCEVNVTNFYEYHQPVIASLIIKAGDVFVVPLVSGEDEYVYGFSYDSLIADYNPETREINALSAGQTEIYFDGHYINVTVLSDGFSEFTVENGVITQYEGTAKTVVIPSEIDGEKITAIGEAVFRNNYDIKDVVIPEGVTTIGEYAFSNCAHLENITLPLSIETIEQCAFNGVNANVLYDGGFEERVNLDIDNWGECNECIIDAIGELYIYTKEDLKALADAANRGVTQEGKTFSLQNNIDLGGEEWVPIGAVDSYYYGDYTVTPPIITLKGQGNYFDNVFKGDFYGNGHTISNFNITRPYMYVGLFGEVENGIISDLKVENANITMDYTGDDLYFWAGLTVGWLLHSEMNNCHASGTINHTMNSNSRGHENCIGGINGRNSGAEILNCTTDVSITVNTTNKSTSMNIGGLTGYIYGTVDNCRTTAQISYNGISEVSIIGGLVGWQAGDSTKITNNEVSGEIFVKDSADKSQWVCFGGLVGYNRKAVSDNVSDVNIRYETENGNSVGELFGYNEGDTQNNIFTGSVMSNEQYILSEINNAENLQYIEEVIFEYRDAIGLDLAEYNSLDSVMKSEVLKLIRTAQVNSFRELKECFDAAVKVVISCPGSSSGGGGSFGGGGPAVFQDINITYAKKQVLITFNNAYEGYGILNAEVRNTEGLVLGERGAIYLENSGEVKIAIDVPNISETYKVLLTLYNESGNLVIAEEFVRECEHNIVVDEGVEPSCTQTGLTEGSHCSECGKVIVLQEEIPAKGHTEVIDERIEPTYESTGLTEGVHCLECGEVLIKQEIIPVLIPEKDRPTVWVSDVSAYVGKTVDITLNLKNNKGFGKLGVEIGYDSSVMTLIKVSGNEEIGGQYTASENLSVNPYNVGWVSESNIDFNGELATFTFEINENAPSGVYPITVEYYKGEQADFTDGRDINIDEAGNSLQLKYEGAAVEINEKPEISDDIEVDSIYYRFTVKVSDINKGGEIIAALYDAADRLVETKIYPAAKSVDVMFDTAGSYVKVLRWDTKTMQPLSYVKTIGK